MKAVFADALYWIALANRRDPWRQEALAARRLLGETTLVTTDEVLSEFLTALSKSGPVLRRTAVQMTRSIMHNPDVHVIAQTRESFLEALDRYTAREDKQYSLADCASMCVMDAEGIREVLTHDRHFEQEGYTVLMSGNRGRG